MDKIYICSRYRADTTEEFVRNLKTARWACRKVVDNGDKPFAPHLLYTQFLDDNKPEERRQGLKMALDDLKYCREMWVIDDGLEYSEGMKEEIKFAKEIGRYICHVRTPNYAENYASRTIYSYEKKQ